MSMRRRAARDLDALDAAAQAAARLVQRLAVLGRDDARDLVEVLFEQLLELEHRARAHDRRRLAPVGKRFGRRDDGGIEIRGGRERRARDDLAARRIEHVNRVCGLGGRPLAADEIGERFDAALGLH